MSCSTSRSAMAISRGSGRFAVKWVDREGKSPLIVASLRHDFVAVVNVLIELGANVNAYRPGTALHHAAKKGCEQTLLLLLSNGGCHAGTALHHAAKKGCEQTLHLLLSNGANPFVLNDDCHTALDLARERGHLNVVRAIESRISLFSGWLREAYGPGFFLKHLLHSY